MYKNKKTNQLNETRSRCLVDFFLSRTEIKIEMSRRVSNVERVGYVETNIYATRKTMDMETCMLVREY